MTGAPPPDAGAYPAMPWALHADRLWSTAHLVELGTARRAVPDGVRVQPVLPGRTAGGLYVAEYRPPSVLAYRELIVSPAIVRLGARLAIWVTHVFVDSPASLAGGRALLGVPKALAEFTGDPEAPEGLRITEGGRELCRLRCGPLLGLWGTRADLRTAHRDVRDSSGAALSVHRTSLRGRLAIGAARASVPPESRLAPLRLGRAWLAVGLGGAEGLFGQRNG